MSQARFRFIPGLVVLALVTVAVLATACSTGGASSGKGVKVVAIENFWGSIATQVGGSHVQVTNIINNPNADPHDYEPTAADARAIADAQYVIVNGAGYDAWADKLLAANPSKSRKVLNIGDALGKKEGDNPHLWYSPEYVMTVAGRIRDDLKTIDSANASAYDQAEQQYISVGLKQYTSHINDIKAKYAGTPVGATESIFSYLAPALGLNLITPPSYLNAVSAGEDVTASDEATVEKQIGQKQIKILVYNSQNTPPNVQLLIDKAKAAGIPVATVNETLTPATASLQDWQSAQLQGIADALQKATGK
ncbi:MAG: ABC transporter substrate-binding protein [Dehalococcoidia bacterium]|nr:ABC transporter substrate-binding protein [Dehalococcoidia bacterium]